MPFFRKRIVEFQAFRIGQEGQPTPVPEWFESLDLDRITKYGLLIDTVDGVELARWGDWVVRNEDGTFSIEDNETFWNNNELVE